MRSWNACALAIAATLVSVSCLSVPIPSTAPAAATATAAKKAPPPDSPQTIAWARILRASDRRVVDDDLRALVHDPDPGVRAKAVRALGQIGDPASEAEIEKASEDTDAGVRAAAAFSMGLLAEPSSNGVLIKLAADADAGVRGAAAASLGIIHDPSAIPTIATLLVDHNTAVRSAAALAAWRFPQPESLVEVLTVNLSGTDPHVRFASSYALARLASAGIVPPSAGATVGTVPDAVKARIRASLAARYGDTNPEVRMQVARGLSSPQSPNEMAIVGKLSGDPEPRVRVSAARALGFPGVSIMPYLARAATDQDVGVARAALESLGKVGGGLAAERLNTVVMKLNGSWLREAGLTSLVQCDASKAPGVVDGLIVNPDPIMRAAAAPMLVGKKDPWAITSSVKLLGDSDPRVCSAAISLMADRDASIASQIGTLFKSPDPVIRAACADAVGTRFAVPKAGVESRTDLFAHLDEIWSVSTADKMPDARLSVLDAAAKAGKDSATRTVLERGLTDPDVIVRRRAVARLHDVFGEDRSASIGPSADRPLEEYLEIARWAATPHAAIVTLQRPTTLPGRFALELDADAAPMAAWNFAQLAGKKFYDGLIVHRVVPNFVVQDGDPRGDGFGGPGYSLRDEYNPTNYVEGTLGMASDGKDTAGSQWFVTESAQPHLDGRYTAFGHVTQGFKQIVTQVQPGDTVVSIRVYEGNGSEPMPAP